MAVACLRMVGRRGVYIPAWRLGTARIQHPAGHGEAEIVELAMTSRVALIDDLGSEAQTATSAVADVIYERHDEDLTTWITTGLSYEDLGARYGAGFLRRIVDGAACVTLGKAKKEAA